MPSRENIPAELSTLGRWLYTARRRQGLTQKELAERCDISQPRISGIEKGDMLPTLPQLLRLAQGLAVPLQWFLNGSTVPGAEVREIALELQQLGIIDLLVSDAVVPAAFRPSEDVIALAVSGNQPEPRIIEAIPAVLAWNRWYPPSLRAYSTRYDRRASVRLAWLADVALTIHRTYGFPGGCPRLRELEGFVGSWSKRKPPSEEDGLGHAGKRDALPPVSKRWKITYDAPLTVFLERAKHLHSLREQQRPRSRIYAQPNDE